MFYLEGWKRAQCHVGGLSHLDRNTRINTRKEYMTNAPTIIHPGEILLEEFLKPLEITQYRIAKDICVPARRINEIVHGDRGISADTALRFAKYFGTTPEFWIHLQSHYDLLVERKASGKKIEKEVLEYQFA